MTLTIDMHYEERLMVVVSKPPFDPQNENLVPALQKFVEKVKGTFFLVVDMREVDISFGDLVTGMAQLRQYPGAEMVRISAVGSGEMIKMGVQAAKQKQYGEYDIALFGTVEEALAHVAKERQSLGL